MSDEQRTDDRLPGSERIARSSRDRALADQVHQFWRDHGVNDIRPYFADALAVAREEGRIEERQQWQSWPEVRQFVRWLRRKWERADA
jgi:hypothetical protein